MSAGRTTILRRRAWTHLAMYAVDMALAITAWIVGFGLTVQNWWALLLLGVAGRWVFFIASGALMYATAREQVAEDRAAEVQR